MKIAQIAPPWLAIPPKNYGGTENVIYNLVEAQVELGHDVTLFAPGDTQTSAKLVAFLPKPLVEEGVPWQAHLKAYYYFQKAIEYISAHDFDFVHTHLSSTADMYLFPLTASLTIPHVTTLHSHFPFDQLSGWKGDADTLFIDEWGQQVPIVGISESACEFMPPGLNLAGIVHHGLPMNLFKPTTSQPEDFFVWLGSFVPTKGTHLAIEAAKRAGVRLVLAGTIDRHNPESMNYFHRVVEPLIDGEQIRYIGPVNMKQKVSLLSRARGFLNPIQWEEPFGMVMIEAMALGCPVISFARGAAPELIVHRKTGFLVYDLDEMVCFIPRIAELDRLQVRAHIERLFSAIAMAQKYLKIYNKLTSQTQRPIFEHLSIIPEVVPVQESVVLRALLPEEPFKISLTSIDAQPEIVLPHASMLPQKPPELLLD